MILARRAPAAELHAKSGFDGLHMGWRVLAAAAAGAAGGFGQAPYGIASLLVLACAVAFALLRVTVQPRRAALIGWAFGAGYFAHVLLWIVEPFQVDAARDGWMAPFALAFMAGGLALFWGLAFWVARLSPRTWPLMLTLTAAEILRAWLFTGFPWGGVSQIVIDGAASQMLAFVGPQGTTLALLAVAWILSLTAGSPRRRLLYAGQAFALGVLVLALHLPLPQPPVPASGQYLRLVQPNAAQHLKWRPEMVEQFYARQLGLTAAPPDAGAAPPDLVVWPETAVPWWLEDAGPVLEEIAAAAGGTPVVLGILREEGGRLRNALVALGPGGVPSAIYDKHHLVPFGEYLPLAGLMRRIGLQGLAEVRGPGFAPGEGPAVLDLGTVGTAMPLICYEAVFPRIVNAAPERPDFLLQITNDAWFGRWAGPQQHLAQARMRAAEQGLPLARSANTGISAMIDPYGRVTASLALGAAGALDAALPQRLPPTLYSRTGDLPVLAVLLLGLLFLLLQRPGMLTPSSESD